MKRFFKTYWVTALCLVAWAFVCLPAHASGWVSLNGGLAAEPLSAAKAHCRAVSDRYYPACMTGRGALRTRRAAP